MKFLFNYMKNHGLAFFASFVLIAISIGTQLYQPKLMKSLINSIVVGDTSTITTLGLWLMVLAFFGLVAGVLNTIIAAKIAQNTGAAMRKDVFGKVQEFSFSNIEDFSASNLVVRLTNDTQQAQNLVMIILQSLLRIPIMLIGSLVLAMISMPSLWWVVVLTIGLVVVVVAVSSGMMVPKFGKIQKLIERVNTLAKENFSGMRVVKSFVQEENEIEKFSGVSKELTKETISVGYIFSIMLPSFFLIMDGGIAFVMFIIGQRADLDPSIIGASTEFISYLVQIMMSLMIGGMMMSFSSRAFVSIGRIQEVMNTEPDMNYAENDAVINSGAVKFDHVSYAYKEDGEEKTLKDISFEIGHGQTLGIIGATGGGKSTLAQLIARIYDPVEGTVTIDGVDLKDIPEEQLRENISLVLQRPILFSGTISDNIRQGKKDATNAELLEAAEIAQAKEFIVAEPGGFEGEVYQRGANFSGGQKQRISIARGVVGKPKVLILDDSTSALDARSEKKVKEALMTRLPNTTKVIVSQKISSIVTADLILVLDDGTLVGSGTHKELVKSSPIYKEIYDTQKAKEKVEVLV